MPNARHTPDETREMRLFSKVIEQYGDIQQATTASIETFDNSLAQFIARRRQPGEGWRTWDELRYELRDVSGEIVSDATIRTWAKRYGVPEGTQADGKGEVTAKSYAAAIKRAGIEL